MVQVVDAGLTASSSAAASPEPTSSHSKHAGPAVKVTKASLSRTPPSVRVRHVEAAFASTCDEPQGATSSRLILLTHQSSTAAHESIELIAVSRKLSSCVHEVRV